MHQRTLFVSPLPAEATNQRLEEIFSEIGPVKQCFVVKEKGDTCRGFGYVIYSMVEDARRALKEVKEYDGRRIIVAVAKRKKDKGKKGTSPTEHEQKPKGVRKTQLKSRLIIRNLSFKCSEDDLKQILSQFGTVLEAKIPLKPDGKMRGFAFVLFKNVCEAGNALNAMNMKEIKGRQVAIDWAVPKDKYIATQQSTAGNIPSKQSVKQLEESQSEEEEEEDDDDDDEDEDASEEEDSEQEEDDDDDKKEDDEDVSQEEDDGSDDDDESSLDSDDDDDDEEEEDKSAKKKISKKLLPSDVKEGRTIFIRNLSFDTEEEGLEEVLLKYGELNYIKIVIHAATGHSKGCAFVQFKTKEAADKCIAEAADEAENGGVRVDGRKLLVVAAVTREDASKLKVDKVKVESGTRNLYLAREGLIRPGTKAAEGVPEADMVKRTRFEEIKRTKLRAINVFVSKNRLCVHNLPKSVDDKKLKALCLQAVKGNKGVRLTECRVMYDKRPVKGQAMGKSLGYGFVQFQDHEHALSTLRYLNNNPDIFGAHKRPIVEFSLEDSKKLKMKDMRQQRNKGTKTATADTPVETQKQGTRFLGFQTKPEVEHVSLENGKKRKKILNFPSHRGPKIRLRDRGKQQAPPPKKGRPGSTRKDRQRQQMEKPTQRSNQKNFKRNGGDRFDSLVEQYKKKLMGNSDNVTNLKRSKWFDS
uniref:RNA-binding protein 28 n=1 Tax=Gasterosteus aculeatus aculeatus TaxID=481459 RepID=G3PGG6_GASAC